MLLGALLDAGASLDAVRSAVGAVVPGEVVVRTSTVTRAGPARAQGRRGEPRRGSPASLVGPDPDAAGVGGPAHDDPGAGARGLRPARRRRGPRARHPPRRRRTSTRWGRGTRSRTSSACARRSPTSASSRVTASPVAVGSGRVHAAHGDLPVPLPAVLELARGWQVLAGGEGELATPTGMALLRTLADDCGAAAPRWRSRRSGSGRARATPRGGRTSSAWSSAPRSPEAPTTSDMWVLETNVDDLDPRLWPTVLVRAAGGRGRRRVARADPDEEGTAGPHPVRPRRRRRAGRAARRDLRADLDAGGAGDAGVPRRAGARLAGRRAARRRGPDQGGAAGGPDRGRPPRSSRTPRRSPGPAASRCGRCSTRRPPRPRPPGSGPARRGRARHGVRTAPRSERPGGPRRSRCRC